MSDNGENKDKNVARRIASGELQLTLASEETTRRNVKMIVEYSKDTRKQVRELAKEVIHLQNQVMTYQKLTEQQNQRIGQLLQVISQGGTSREVKPKETKSDGDNSRLGNKDN